MLEQGPGATQPLLPGEERAYGVSSQTVLSRGPQSSAVRLTLRALPSRPILIETMRNGGACLALSTVVIAGAPAHLYNVHAKMSWPFGLDYLLLSGWSMDGQRLVHEKLSSGGASDERHGPPIGKDTASPSGPSGSWRGMVRGRHFANCQS
jgi:hypothetical protein